MQRRTPFWCKRNTAIVKARINNEINTVTVGVFPATSGFKLKKTVTSLVFVRFSGFFTKM